MKVLNFTPHTICICNAQEIIREYPSAGLARVSVTYTTVGEVDGVPEPAEDTVYIVSMAVASIKIQGWGP